MQSSDTPASIEEYHAILREDFLSFARKCFEHLNPATKLLLTWHLEALAYQIELIIRGDTKRLIVNIQPRSLKSFFFSIVLPAFLLGRFPTKRIICVSYSQELASKLARDFLKIVRSDWYIKLFRPAP